jgi:hypothetical protein
MVSIKNGSDRKASFLATMHACAPECLARPAERVAARHDVEYELLERTPGMVERHTVRAMGAAVLPDDEEPVEWPTTSTWPCDRVGWQGSLAIRLVEERRAYT